MLKRAMSRVLQFLSGFLTVALIITLSLTIYFGIQECNEELPTFNLQKAKNRKVEFSENSSEPREFSFVVFTDPQLGLYDVIEGNDGTSWEHDILGIEKFGKAVAELNPNFIFCAGDLNNAYPDDHDDSDGFKSAYRPPQTLELMDAFNKYIPADIPTMMIAGNHDMTEHPSRLHVHPYEMVWGQNYYHFWVGGHLFIALESQYFRSDEDATSELREQHIIWLETLLESVPFDTPKTVFQHAPLFIDNYDEYDSEMVGKAIPKKYRQVLLDIYCKHNIRNVYSGHTHFHQFPDVYNCLKIGETDVRQVILTSINSQLQWTNNAGTHFPKDYEERGVNEFMSIKVGADGKTFTEETIKLL